MNKKSEKDGRAGVGTVFTFAWVGMLVIYFVSNFDKVTNLEPNEFGDFMAGAFGPVALFWLVVGYFQQGEELQQNTEALRLQHEELVRSVAEQKLLVAEQQAQTAIAKTQLEEQRQQYTENALSRMRAARPKFAISADFGGFGGDSLFWNISVQCYGNNCTDCSLTAYVLGGSSQWHFVNELRAGSSVEFHTELSRSVANGFVVVGYQDILGHRRRQSFEMQQVDESYDKRLEFTAQADVEEDHFE